MRPLPPVSEYIMEFIIILFLLPWTLFGWIIKYLFSGIVWATIFGIAYYFIFTKEWEYSYKFRNPFTRERKRDVDIDDIDWENGA